MNKLDPLACLLLLTCLMAGCGGSRGHAQRAAGVTIPLHCDHTVTAGQTKTEVCARFSDGSVIESIDSAGTTSVPYP